MESDMENSKWLDDYTSLKQVSPNNPFTVPSGYFDDLEQRITSYVKLDELIQNGEGFAVPQNYFEELTNTIDSRITIEEFAGAEVSGLSVPEGYFDNLQAQINARIQIEEALNESEGDFTVPAGYFERLNKDILNKTVNQDMVKRKGIVRKMYASGAFKYAAAACFALIIGSGIFVIQMNSPVVTDHDSSFLHKQVQTISVSDIQSYLQQDVDASDTQHAVIDEDAPVNDAGLNSALKDINDTNQ